MNTPRQERTWLLCGVLVLAACAGPTSAPDNAKKMNPPPSSPLMLEDEKEAAEHRHFLDAGTSDYAVLDAGEQVALYAQWNGGNADGGIVSVPEQDAGPPMDAADEAESEPADEEPARVDAGALLDSNESQGATFSAFSSHSDAGAPALQNTCDDDEHDEGGVCVANERDCDIPNGQGEQKWRVNRWGACLLVSCDADYHPSSGRCVSDTRICSFSNGVGVQTWADGIWGNCILDRCNDGYHAESGVCYDNVRPCTLNNGEGTQVWEVDAWGDCIPDACEDAYHIEGIDCVSNVRTANVPNGIGNEYWDGNQWTAFVLTSCDGGYHNGGEGSCVPVGQCTQGYDLDALGDCKYIVNYEAGPNGMEFAKVPAGTFSMGSPPNETGRSPNETQHWVRISNSFLMGMTEVTQAQWRAVAGENPAHFSSCGDNCPVESVGWYSTLAFANALSEAEGLESCYTFEPASCADEVSDWADGEMTCDEVFFAGVDCTGYRLPTEAEWEYAYRGGTSTAFYSGNILEMSYSPLDNNLDAIGWYGGNSGVTYAGGYDCFGWYFPGPDFCGTQPVCGKLKNPYGLCDMSGNVWEWTWDFYALYQGTATDPTGPETGSIRVLRGGSWRYYAYAARAAYRYYFNPYRRFSNSGFRLARTLP